MKTTYAVKWMHCASCATTISKIVSKIPWVNACDVNIVSEKAAIETEWEITVETNALNEMLKPYWYTMTEDHMHDHGVWWEHDHAEADTEFATMKQTRYLVFPFVLLSVIYMVRDIGSVTWTILPVMPGWVSTFWHHLFPIMAAIVMARIGLPYLASVGRFLRTGVANMETLVGLGTGIAFLYSFALGAFENVLKPYLNVEAHFYDVTIIVLGLVWYGKYLETKAKRRTGAAIEALLHLQAKSALVERWWEVVEIPVEQVVVWDIIHIKPWSKVPVDGMIVEWLSALDESMITGEPLPADKQVGDRVIWGTMNTYGFIKMQATSTWEQWMLAHIIALVEQAQSSKAPIQHLVDKVASIFVPIVLIIAVVTFVVWRYTWNPIQGLVSAIGVLVIACPCALGLATPTAISAWVGVWATHGILIKDAASFQKLVASKVIVFDKTGTLTYGKPVLGSYQGKERTADLKRIALLEAWSEHPLAHALVQAAREEGYDVWSTVWSADTSSLKEFKNHPWKWVEWVVDGQRWYAGNKTFMQELWYAWNWNGWSIWADKSVTSIDMWYDALTPGETPVFLANASGIQACFGITDSMKPGVKEAVAYLHGLGLKTVLLSGDHSSVAKHIAGQAGIQEVIAEVLPDQKAAVISDLQQKYGRVVMCGDGINDAAALAQADVSIAMATGTDIAMQSSDIVILAWDISKIVQAFHVAKLTLRTISQNLFWAFFYNIVGIPFAAWVFIPLFGWSLNPVIAWAAMAFSSISVVTNSLRIQRKRF